MIYHTMQDETSHFRFFAARVNYLRMSESEVFRANLKRFREERGMAAAELSRQAGMNLRGVKDIEEGRSQSPKLSTIISLANALDVDVIELLSAKPRPRINRELEDFLSQYDEEAQVQFLTAFRAIAPRRP